MNAMHNYHYVNSQTIKDFTAKDLKEAKKHVEHMHLCDGRLTKGWTFTWLSKDGSHYLQIFNSKGTSMASKGYGARLASGKFKAQTIKHKASV